MAQIQPKAITLKRFIEKCHYAPRPVDDSFSKDLYHKILEELDPYHIYLDATQLKKLEPYQTTLDDELNGKPASFTKEFAAAYHDALLTREKLAKEILLKPASFAAGTSFNYSKNEPVAKDAAAMKQRWQQYLQWRILARIYEKWEIEQVDSAEAKIPATNSEWFTKAEKSARESFTKRIELRIVEQEKGGIAETEKLVNEIYLQSIANCFDPHTDYFDSRKQKEFSESLSSEVLEFGFGMQETEEGDIVISDLKPGSAAWNSGNIYPDDKLVKIKTHDGKVINAKEDGFQTVSKALDNTGKEEIELTLQSADGKIRQVKLQKNETQNEENLVRGYLLTGPRRLGYISLPSFYTNWGEDKTGSGCANDLSKEILKLKREKIEGLILDLRYNGGGSLQEAIELAGIFIEAGPMTIVKESSGERETLKDPSRGSIYDGPLMVLINGQSASASELVAGTLQDYKRAVIMGSPSFGKATMQMTLPMDTAILTNRMVDEKKYNPTKKYDDYVNVTIGKIYRVSGSTNQLEGVKPDLELPDAFSSFDYTERSLDFALPSDTIVQKVPFAPMNGLYPTNNFALATAEINKTPYFEKLAAWVAEMKRRNEDNTIPLQWEAYAAYEASNTPPEEKPGKTDSAKTIKAENTSYTIRLLELYSEWEKENNQWFLDDLLNDPYILSAYTAMSKIFF